MIASLFSKSRPFNYVLLTFLLVLCYLVYQIKHNFSSPTEDFTIFGIIEKGFILILLVASVFVTNFIAKKNGLSKDSSYSFLFFFLFILFIPSVFDNSKIILASFFVLLALRRLISMKSMITPKEKIFDASLWIFIATLFHFWSILFIVIVFISIILHVSNDYRNWIIPFIAFFTVFILFFFFSLIIDKQWINVVWNQIQLDFEFYYFTNSIENLSLSIWVLFSVFFLLAMIFTLSKRPIILHASYQKILFSMVIAVMVYIFSTNKSNDLLIFGLMPLSVLATAYIEQLRDAVAKEVITASIAILGLLLFVFQL